jgi:hypothetical protein
MTALWITIAALVALGAAGLAAAVGRVRSEIGPTLDSFADLRDALVPATLALDETTARLRGLGDAARRGNPGTPE